MNGITITEQAMFRKFCPCIEKPCDACYCTKLGGQYTDKMLYFCCNYFKSCEIFSNLYPSLYGR